MDEESGKIGCAEKERNREKIAPRWDVQKRATSVRAKSQCHENCLKLGEAWNHQKGRGGAYRSRLKRNYRRLAPIDALFEIPRQNHRRVAK